MEKAEPKPEQPEVQLDPSKDPVLRRLMQRPLPTNEEIELVNAGGALLEDWKKVKTVELKGK